jgi:hypothetical protein
MPERLVKLKVSFGATDPPSPKKPGIWFLATHEIKRSVTFDTYDKRQENYASWPQAQRQSTDLFFDAYTCEETNARLEEVRKRSDSRIDSLRTVNESQGVEIKQNNERITEVESKLTSMIKSEVEKIIEAMHQVTAAEISEQLSAAIESIANKAIEENMKPIQSRLDEIDKKLSAQ